MGVFPLIVLCGTLFLVYAIASEALSHNPLGSPAAINAVRLRVRIVLFARLIIALVFECLGIVGFRIIPHCWSSISRS